MALMNAFKLFSVLTYVAFAYHFMAPTPLHPYKSACGIGYTSEKTV